MPGSRWQPRCVSQSGVGTGNPDTGERHPCGRDLDHTNPDVRAAIKKYLRRLKAVGFRGREEPLARRKLTRVGHRSAVCLHDVRAVWGHDEFSSARAPPQGSLLRVQISAYSA